MTARVWIVAAMALALLTGEAAAQGAWKQAKPIPEGANEGIGAPIADRVYVYGGQNMRSQALGIFWSYDPKTDSWTKLSSNPVPVHHGAAVAVGTKFYVIGGFRLPDTGKTGWYPENKAW